MVSIREAIKLYNRRKGREYETRYEVLGFLIFVMMILSLTFAILSMGLHRQNSNIKHLQLEALDKCKLPLCGEFAKKAFVKNSNVLYLCVINYKNATEECYELFKNTNHGDKTDYNNGNYTYIFIILFIVSFPLICFIEKKQKYVKEFNYYDNV